MIGVGIITCDRLDFFEECLKSIPFDRVDYVCVVNDGKEWVNDKVPAELKEKIYLIQHTVKHRQGVAISKNQALRHLIANECDHIFLIEDDIIVKDPNVFQAYIDASKETGIQHFMFGYHGPANKTGSGGEPKPKYKIPYKNGVTIALNEHCVGAFCYYSAECLYKCGYLDTRFYNAFEHVEHSYKLAKAGYTTPYWNWADLANSTELLGEQACSEDNSSIRGHEGWNENIQTGYEIFKKTHGVAPFGVGGVQDTPLDEIKLFLKELYGKTHISGN
jgi:GT2 family glycosyltransferase